MPSINLRVEVFDPAVPFDTHEANYPTIDTWHEMSLITKELRDKLPYVTEIEIGRLSLPGGMSMQVPIVEIGIKIGTIKIKSFKFLVVDEGLHDILLGAELIKNCFELGAPGKEATSVVSPWQEDSESLSLEIFSVSSPFDQVKFERYLVAFRQLYNILLIASGEIDIASVRDVNDLVDDDQEIPKELRLKISWVDSGSIWMGLKSGSMKTLRMMSNIFDASASAKLAQQVADSKKAEDEAYISRETRDATARKITEEQEMHNISNIKKSYDVWRREAKARVKFLDEMIDSVENEEIAGKLRKKKDEAILALVEQELIPMVQNIPKPREALDGVLLLPPPEDDKNKLNNP